MGPLFVFFFPSSIRWATLANLNLLRSWVYTHDKYFGRGLGGFKIFLGSGHTGVAKEIIVAEHEFGAEFGPQKKFLHQPHPTPPHVL